MKKIYFHLLIITIVGLIAYSNSFNVPFQFDDLRIIPDNPYIKNLDNFIPFHEPHEYNPMDEYNPRRYIGYLSLALNYRWGGINVTGYHIVNFLMHLTNGILVYFFVILTFRTPYFRRETLDVKRETSGTQDQESKTDSQFTIHDSRVVDNSRFTIHHSHLIALFSALLFVSHPVQTQAVTYIVQRFTSLAALFYLASVVLYVKGRLACRPAGKLASYLLCLLSAVCAMKTKEIAFTLPIMILLCEFIFFRASRKRKLLLLVPVLLTLVIVPLSMLHIDKPLGEVLSDLSEKSRLQTDMSREVYLMTEMRVIVTYIRLLLLPVNQNLDYDYPIERSFFSLPVLLSFLFLLTLFGIAVYLLYRSRQETTVSSKKLVVSSEETEAEGGRSGNDSPFTTHYSLFTIHYSRLIAFGILWFFLALSVESSFIPIVDVIFEHRLYLPSAGAFIASTAALFAVAIKMERRWPLAEKALVLLLLVIVTGFSVATFARNRIWQDEMRLWEDVVRKSPGSARAHNDLGFIYIAKGLNDQAIEQLNAALLLRPAYPDARVNLGIAYNAKGMYDQAIIHFMIALSMAPDDADAHNNLGISYVSKGMIDQAINQYRIALRIQPDYAEAYNNLGVAYGKEGKLDQARENFEQAIRLKPVYFEAYNNLALVYRNMGDDAKAEELYRKAGQMKPASALP